MKARLLGSWGLRFTAVSAAAVSAAIVCSSVVVSSAAFAQIAPGAQTKAPAPQSPEAAPGAAPAAAPATAPAAPAPGEAPSTEAAAAGAAGAAGATSDPFAIDAEPKAPGAAEQGPEDVLEEKKPGAGEDPLSQPRVVDISGQQTKPVPPPAPPPDPNTLPFTYHQKHVDLALGIRVASATHEGLEFFSESPVLPEFVARAGTALFAVDRFALAALLEVGVAGTGAPVREAESHLNLTRFSLGVEGRYHFHHRMYAYARVAPGFELAGASLTWDLTSEMRDNSAAFQIDGALGAALRLAGSSDGRVRTPRLWFFLEGGFRYASAHKLVLAFPEGTGPSRAEPLTLSPLATTGGLGSAGLMVTF